MALTSNNMGNMGNMGLAPSAEGGAYPAASLPFGDLLTKPSAGPPRSLLVGSALLEFGVVRKRRFPDEAWHPSFRAQTILAEFAATKWPALLKDSGFAPDPKVILDGKNYKYTVTNSFDDIVEDEIKDLLALAASRRPVRLAEIVAQADDARPYWSDMLLAGPAIRPYIWTLVETGLAVGQMVAMHFKAQYSRARPAQVYPALMPPILTPPHASYPNAHALQSLLMSGCAKLAAPELSDPLDALANRIGENREIAGVHYPSDRIASQHIADKVLPQLQKCQKFKDVLKKAKLEY